MEFWELPRGAGSSEVTDIPGSGRDAAELGRTPAAWGNVRSVTWLAWKAVLGIWTSTSGPEIANVHTPVHL
jgi:hypothetical protein